MQLFKIYKCYIIVIALVLVADKIGCTKSNYKDYDYEQMLLEKLLKNYNNKLRPSGKLGTVQVEMALNINQIIDIMEKDQIMIINAFVDHKWIDSRLSWSEYDLF
jgi:hypothetical protein